MPYKDPEKQREYVKTHRDHIYAPPTMEEPRRYYVIRRPNGPEITSTDGGRDNICGPVTLLEATNAYIAAGGLAADLYLE